MTYNFMPVSSKPRWLSRSTSKEYWDITYKLPNKHYIPVDMKYINIDNMTPLSTILLHYICFLRALRYQYAPDKEA